MTGTYAPKYIWKYTETDGDLPIANYTSEVKLQVKNKNSKAGLGSIKKPGTAGITSA
jgi:hypothetical protein